MYHEVKISGQVVGWAEIRDAGLDRPFEINKLVMNRDYSPRNIGGVELRWAARNPDEILEPAVPGFYKVDNGSEATFVVFQLRPNNCWYSWNSREFGYSGVSQCTWDHVTTYLGEGRKLVRI